MANTRQAEQATFLESAELLQAQNRVLEQIVNGAPLPKVLETLLQALEAQCPGMLGSILLLDPDGVTLRHGAAPSLPESLIRYIDGRAIGPKAGSCGTAAFRGEPVIVEDIASDPLWDDYREFALGHGLQACWSTPIFDGKHRLLGTFALYFREPGSPSGRHLRLIEMATSTVSIAILKNQETEALRISEERLRLAVTGGNVGIWEWKIASGRLVWSCELKGMFGFPAEGDDLTLERLRQAIHPEDRSRVEASLQKALSERTNYAAEYRIVLPDGRVRWIQSTGRGEYAEGVPVRMIGVALDVTDRKTAEEEINRREGQLAEAQRIAQVGSYEWDVASGRVFRSAQLCAIFGLRPEEFEPSFEGYLRRVHPEDQSATKQTIEEAFRRGAPFDFEERIVRPDGAVRVLHSRGSWVCDAEQRPQKLLGTCQDITERMNAEDQLRRSEERFQIVARATNDAIWDWDLATDRVWWNQGIFTLFQYPPEQVDGASSWRLARLHPDDVDRVASGMRAVMERKGQFWSAEYRFRRFDSSYADIFDRAFVTYDDAERPVRMIGAMIDISERKQALEMLEQRVSERTAELRSKNSELEHEINHRKRIEDLLRDRNEELKSYAYTVSHDLKAPLRGIAGYARELDRRHRTGLTERAHFCVDQILTAAGNLDHLIEDLLYYSRLDAQKPLCVELNLAHVVDDILEERKAAIQEHSADVAVELSAVRVRTWELGISQIVANLVDNAIKYSRGAKPPRITISSQELPNGFRLTVADNGIGFDMKYAERIFGLFNRLVRQEEFEGTGAGLAIVKKVVEKLYGRIWTESKPGAGATFFVELPAGPALGARG